MAKKVTSNDTQTPAIPVHSFDLPVLPRMSDYAEKGVFTPAGKEELVSELKSIINSELVGAVAYKRKSLLGQKGKPDYIHSPFIMAVDIMLRNGSPNACRDLSLAPKTAEEKAKEKLEKLALSEEERNSLPRQEVHALKISDDSLLKTSAMVFIEEIVSGRLKDKDSEGAKIKGFSAGQRGSVLTAKLTNEAGTQAISQIITIADTAESSFQKTQNTLADALAAALSGDEKKATFLCSRQSTYWSRYSNVPIEYFLNVVQAGIWQRHISACQRMLANLDKTWQAKQNETAKTVTATPESVTATPESKRSRRTKQNETAKSVTATPESKRSRRTKQNETAKSVTATA